MTWARLDDQTATNPAWVKIADVALRAASVELFGSPRSEISARARLLAQRAKAVHLLTLMWSVPALTDGKISPAGVEQVCAIGSLTEAEWYEAADLLVEAGAWRSVRPSKKEPLGSYVMKLGWGPNEQPTREEDQTRRKRARLRDALREGGKDYPMRVAAVARAAGRCEYCDSSTVDRACEIDHVDPGQFSNALDNLAHACIPCNRKKGAHRLDEVGMDFTKRAKKARGITNG